MNVHDYKGIWVFAEQNDGRLRTVGFELLAKATELKAKTGEPVTAVLLGATVASLAPRLLRGGADAVILAEHPNLESYKTNSYTGVLYTLIEKHKPSIFLLGATDLGRDLAPRLMARLGTGLTADCLDLDVDDNGVLVQTKPSYGGNIMCTITVPRHRPQMSTIRPKVFSPLEERDNPDGVVLVEVVDVPDEPHFEILGTESRQTAGMALADAPVIVAVGRGVKQEDLPMMRELASLLGGKVGCTRPLVDAGWFDHSDQIGQSGTTVRPKLIVNVGISGAVQYAVGMQKADLIVTINKNPNAELFCVSHYGIVGDYATIVSAILETLKAKT